MARAIIQHPSGFTDLLALLSVIENKEVFSARLKELNDTIANANVAIASATKAEALEAMQLRLNQEARNAANHEKVAREAAAALIAETKDEIAAKTAAIESTLASLKKSTAEHELRVKEETANIAAAKQSLARAQDNAIKAQMAAEAAQAQAETVKRTFVDKLAKLNASLRENN